MDAKTLGMIVGVLLILGTATGIVYFLKRRNDYGIDPTIIETFRSRVRAWWLLFACLAGAFMIGKIATVILFGLISFWALREFITLTPTRPADHRTLFWVFFLCTPLQFVLVSLDPDWLRSWFGIDNYAMFSIVIPVYVFLLVPARIAMSGDAKRFLERTAKIQTGLLICVYCLSYAPALLTLDISAPRSNIHDILDQTEEAINQGLHPGEASLVDLVPPDAQQSDATPPNHGSQSVGATSNIAAAGPETVSGQSVNLTWGHKLRLLFFLVLIVQLSDAFQYLWSQLPSKHYVSPDISTSRTWEGVFAGSATVALIGGTLWWATPLPYWWEAVAISAIISLMGFAGNLTMSAIKRDRGVSDYGTLIAGHSGVLDRIDSLCFAAPVFYHLTYFFMTR